MAEISIKERKKKQGSSIFAIRTTIGQEKLVAQAMVLRIENKDIDIKAILVPQVLKGYIFVEAMEAATVSQCIRGLRHVRGYDVVGKVDISEIEHFLIPTPPTQGLNVNDVVEIISGPFKGEKAKITRIDSSKDEVILELFESPYPIPIRVHGDFIKLVRSSEEKGEEEEPEEEEELEEEEEEEETLEDEEFFKL
ncbi:MAG: transcription elongation factor Spt5 [Candidatus Lokiarchaeota archaeon]|nr:transcription elongation factor Spt5 [Candidatus Lokiarchaeota archaeon]